MKKLIIIIFLAALALALSTSAGAAGTAAPAGADNAAAGRLTDDDIQKSQSDALETDKLERALPEEAGKTLGNMKVTDSLDLSGGLQKILKSVSENVGGIFSGALKSAVVILLIAVLCGVVSSAFDAASKYVILAGILAISVVSVSNVSAFIGLGGKTLDEMNTFSKMLLPTLTTAAAASGAITSAAAKYAATALFMDILMTVAKNVVMPLIYAYTATSIAEAALGGEGLAGASNLLKWLAKTLMTVAMLLFIAYLSLTGVITGSVDAASTKALKSTISTVLPVVGSIIADASETVLAGASILRNAIGVFGLLAVVGTCILPFLRLGANYLLYKAAAGLSAAIADSRITKLVNAVSTAFGMMLGLVGSSALMLFISIISVIKVVT
ncbi:stage III sporulation protein AE [Sporobacter termitidis DSM 10068]|uniref:Stage III sporulation protein AE n=1 Tax=Sporobacter termitidis DSM 10068 TaxID=1123282 RepID=A0A1M5Y8H9_9FIRM|nr:stage III sporulation protein AE [Sporobacter termitidis]SHI08282.1 stage III sporulation protein AE [Sporobacter termitidis DSM 10068]